MQDDYSTSSSVDDKEISSSEPSSSYNTNQTGSAEGGRDEVKEIERLSQKETSVIRTWRIILLVLLLLTAVSVTTVTYILLKSEDENAYKAVFEKFSDTIGNAAVDQQKNIREGYQSLADAITAYSQSQNAEWPFFRLPMFESYAANTIKQTGAENMVLFTIVPGDLREPYVSWMNNQYYDIVAEGNMLRYGNLDRMPSNSTYQADIIMASPKGFIPDNERDSYHAVSVWSPPPFSFGIFNWNPASIPDYGNVLEAAKKLRNQTVFTRVRPYNSTVGVSMTQEEHEALHSVRAGSSADHPHSFVWHPVHKEIGNKDSEIVAILGAGIAWDVSLRNLLPDSMIEGVFVVLRNNCEQEFTYLLRGPDALFLGEGDLHDTNYDDSGVSFDLSETDHKDYATTDGHCLYSISVYPTPELKKSFEGNTPKIFASVVAGTFLLMAISFLFYDAFVQRRNKKLVHNAARSNAIVTSLFPENVRDRLVSQEEKRVGSTKAKLNVGMGMSTEGVPIADLFLESTVMFADIVGFTAWSSVREPAQVFTLLESLYGAFDVIADKRRVFKVETVGDCYVAATGIPTYRKDHATAMIRFARDIMLEMNALVKKLEVTLGPDTGDLKLRIGIHSGPVTAGVLRGKKSRFQLFGDTMNTTARIESSSLSGKIQLSSETAKLLIQDGKEHWIEKRPDIVTAKGKGSIQTYFVRNLKKLRNSADTSSGGSSHDHSVATDDEASEKDMEVKDGPCALVLSEKTQRLVDWNTETLLQLLRRIVACRLKNTPPEKLSSLDDLGNQQGAMPFEEIKEIIHLPEFDEEHAKLRKNPGAVQLDEVVQQEVRHYVTCIAKMYRDNAFHNFEHASHVTMSVTKLLSRIVAPTDVDGDDHNVLHDHTYGITSDPLTQFACAFSALIHDVDHTGVPNTQLIKENSTFASVYKEKSVAEQNSLVLSWDLLMDDQFMNFRRALFQTKSELLRFRQLVVNSVMATDIADKDLKTLRNDRWAKAFDQKTYNEMPGLPSKEEIDRKATIVIEHLIQASDISHTMQHWHIYRKWNERLFTEMYQAYVDGRSEADPSTFWYKGEIGFFDFYIIPLAKKLKECGVFGISSDEYLNYALKNREEWELRGQEVVSEMMEKIPSMLSRRNVAGVAP